MTISDEVVDGRYDEAQQTFIWASSMDPIGHWPTLRELVNSYGHSANKITH